MVAVYDPTPILEAARGYLARGWRIVPIPYKQKRPILKGWRELTINADNLAEYFSQPANVGLMLGESSGGLVNIDLDCPESLELAERFLPPTPCKTGRPSRLASHWWYIAPGAKTKQCKDPETKAMIVELRSTGGQTVVGPSIHPTGEQYDELAGTPAAVSAEELLKAVTALHDAIVKRRYPNGLPERERRSVVNAVGQIQDDLDPAVVERRAISYLATIPSAISGQGGHSHTFTAAMRLVHGFDIEPDRALQILLEHYNPRCEPPWTEKELRHKVEDAARKPHDLPRGHLKTQVLKQDPDVDLSALIHRINVRPVVEIEHSEPAVEQPTDPGSIPPELLRIPGFVSEVMDHCLEVAPYPNQVLAFSGALALQAFLAGRKVRDQADNRTNVYLLSLAHSAAGKDWPRKVNTQIVYQVGLAGCLGDRFASGEGIQDSLFTTPSMLFQTDEIDGLLQSINRAKDARHESIMGTLLTMYSASNSVFPMRRKANSEAPGAIDQPSLVIYGTAIPKHYYDALSERMLTNGFFARMIILESGPRNPGQEPKIREPPPRIIETAKWWTDFRPGKGNLENWHPVPAVVEYTDDAKAVLIESRQTCEAEYAKAEERGDPVGTTVWGRVNEHSRKLALLHAISVNSRSPRIDLEGARWATRFAMHQTRRMLFMAHSHVAENPFHAECLKLLQKLRDAPAQTLAHSVALKRMKMDTQAFQKVIDRRRHAGAHRVWPSESCPHPGVGGPGGTDGRQRQVPRRFAEISERLTLSRLALEIPGLRDSGSSGARRAANIG